MNAEYILPKLKTLSSLLYGGEAFAKYSEQRDKYIFGSITEKGTFKNVVTEAIAIYLTCLTNKK